MTPTEPEAQAPLRQRLLWFVGIWAASVGTMFVLAFLLRLWLAPGAQ